MANSDYEPVTFLDADGNEISNDPVWHARNTLAAAGVDESTVDDSSAELQSTIDAKNQEIAALKAALEARDTLDADEDNKDDGDDYDKLGGKELQTLAKDRGVDIKGLRKVSEVRAALRAADQA